MVAIRLQNSLTRRKDLFTPLDASNVRMYVCGPTVYDRAHLGNARPVVVFDVLFRLLREVYGEEHVTYVRNFTDVDDKINARAVQTGRPIDEITEETIAWYHQDMDALGALRPTHEPRATAHIAQMIAMIERLIARGHAYEVAGHVLFDVRSYPEYGRLSGRSVDDMIAGARVEVAPYKRDAMDFVLWKPSDPSLPGWESPWGRGRPGWHIECSAMAHELLGASFDIHGGGQDLQFPHHENEVAQSCCAFPDGDFARYWLHNEMVQVEGRKMSKSLGNFFTVRDLLDEGWPGEVIRFVMLSTHYRKPMDWTKEKAREAEETLSKWCERLLSTAFAFDAVHWQTYSKTEHFAPDAAVLDSLREDLNVHAAIQRMHQLAKSDDLKAQASLLGSMRLLGLVNDWTDVKRLSGRIVTAPVYHPDVARIIDQLIEDRKTARQERNFDRADEIRKILEDSGVKLEDSPSGTTWRLDQHSFDPAKLEALK